MNDATYRIRPATAEDLAALPEVERDAAQRYREVGYAFCAEGEVRSEEEHRRGLERGALFVAEGEDGIVGFALVWEVDGRAHLLELSVRRAAQGRGLGTRLLGAAEAWASARGFAELTLTTYRDVTWNAPWYERMGYRPFDPEPWRSGLAEIQRVEAAFGYAVRPRVAMAKVLRGRSGGVTGDR